MNIIDLKQYDVINGTSIGREGDIMDRVKHF